MGCGGGGLGKLVSAHRPRPTLNPLVAPLQSRATSYELPSDGHTYGKVVAKDDEGAGAVLSNWVAAQPSKPKVSQRSFVKTNMMALREGCVGT